MIVMKCSVVPRFYAAGCSYRVKRVIIRNRCHGETSSHLDFSCAIFQGNKNGNDAQTDDRAVSILQMLSWLRFDVSVRISGEYRMVRMVVDTPWYSYNG